MTITLGTQHIKMFNIIIRTYRIKISIILKFYSKSGYAWIHLFCVMQALGINGSKLCLISCVPNKQDSRLMMQKIIEFHFMIWMDNINIHLKILSLLLLYLHLVRLFCSIYTYNSIWFTHLNFFSKFQFVLV
jgi:hypothetical protein